MIRAIVVATPASLLRFATTEEATQVSRLQ